VIPPIVVVSTKVRNFTILLAFRFYCLPALPFGRFCDYRNNQTATIADSAILPEFTFSINLTFKNAKPVIRSIYLQIHGADLPLLFLVQNLWGEIEE